VLYCRKEVLCVTCNSGLAEITNQDVFPSHFDRDLESYGSMNRSTYVGRRQLGLIDGSLIGVFLIVFRVFLELKYCMSSGWLHHQLKTNSIDSYKTSSCLAWRCLYTIRQNV
jgi:hypothetical protein